MTTSHTEPTAAATPITEATTAVGPVDPVGGPSRTPMSARAALAAAGVLFAAYPALRPWTDETTLAGAAAFASPAWVAAHTMGMFAFMLLTVALALRSVAVGTGWANAVVAAVGTALILPYYGAETFGLPVIGARALADGDASLLELAGAFRYAPVPMVLFGLGLLALAAAGVLLVREGWRSRGLARVSELLTGLMLALYLAQYFGTPAMRIGHGVLLALGCLLMAAAWGGRRGESRDSPPC
ncbi:hypothetical protein EXU48_12160 [Occultella glacieicola]|uniref:Uncharacterized protein n=1 Tax=Occultella glacieicola TaxID=2518684 RepID=A0ABY2E3H9_9MICO|nr:hypothetical protein [Occultella glacieicola]TDE94184.1 hypothetical protein EXU48_12160 [Occultella glacieicola]